MLTACSNDSEQADVPPVSQVTSDDTSSQPIELGTAVKDVITTPKAADPKDGDMMTLKWDDLVPPDFQPEKIMAKYQAQIQAAGEGSKEEVALFKKVMDEFNNAGPNTALNGKKVRIPGFVAPLDSDGETVVEFLLVPYFGSCIHSPPPPANQTVMVSPEVGKSVTLNQIYKPVWVIGELQAEEVNTDLAKAGYQIKNARVEGYIQPAN